MEYREKNKKENVSPERDNDNFVKENYNVNFNDSEKTRYKDMTVEIPVVRKTKVEIFM